ncbi:MAG TPA: tetratricopeptide repeat protein, partial [Terriglobales bacterium]|nr:tetratricopeptide repeat protein [Terriglobales bacterium]
MITRLSALAEGSVVSITGIEGIFPDPQKRLETLVALSFQRERLAALALKQIWWIPSHLSEQFILGIPDLDSWFQLRLHLTEVPRASQDQFESLAAGTTELLDVSEARALASRFLERSSVALERGVPVPQIWSDLGQPAYTALTRAGLIAEAREILAGFLDLAKLPGLEAVPMTGADGRFDANAARALGEFALALSATGSYLMARGWQEQILETTRRLLGAEHPATLEAMNNLAQTLYAQGDLAGARTLQERVLAARNRVLGEEHLDTLISLNNLAGTLKAQGDLAGARTLQEHVLASSRRVLGEQHPRTLTAMNNLAQTLFAQGNIEAARKLQENVRTARRQLLGEDHPATLTATNNLAGTLKAQGDLAGARRLQEQTLTSIRRRLGEEHPNTLRAVSNLAQILFAQGDLEAARAAQEQVLESSLRLLGEDHPDTLTA